MSIKHVLLDLDDTILDFHKSERIALSKTFLEFGIDPSESTLSLYSQINRECWQRLERLELTRDEVLCGRFAILFDRIGVVADERAVQARYEYNLSFEAHFLTGAEQMLEYLYGKYKLYIASNGTAIVQDRRIDISGIAKYFDGIFISQRLEADKPSPEFFRRAIAAMGDPLRDEIIIVGDSLTSDIKGGEDAGIHTCYFNPRGYQNKTEITPEYEISSYEELYPVLGSIK